MRARARYGLAVLGGFIGIGAVAVLLVTPASRVIREEQVLRPDALARLDAGPIGQSFLASAPHLTEIQLVMTAPPRTPLPPIRVRLWEPPDGLDRVTRVLTPTRLPLRHEWLRVRFPALADSAGREFAFSVDAGEAGGERVRVWGHGGDPYPEGSALQDGSPRTGDLAFRVGYRTTGLEALSLLGQRLTADRPGPWGAQGLYIGLAILYLTGVGVLLSWVARPGAK